MKVVGSKVDYNPINTVKDRIENLDYNVYGDILHRKVMNIITEELHHYADAYTPNITNDDLDSELMNKEINPLTISIISTFEKFLNDRGIVIPNFEKVELLGAGEEVTNIFGNDYISLAKDLTEVITNEVSKNRTKAADEILKTMNKEPQISSEPYEIPEFTLPSYEDMNI